jgi:hypothetical protein
LTVGSVTGGGERITAGWRFWPKRPRVDVEIAAPAPWGGLWAVDLFGERQPFSNDVFPTSRRSGAGLSVSNWISGWARLSARAGIDAWDDRAPYGVASGDIQFASARERLNITVDGSSWFGDDPFGTIAASMRLRSRTEQRGRVLVGRMGVGVATSSTPADLWFAGDTGKVRPMLLRAHPVIDDGALRSDRLGRRIVHFSAEAQQWWTVRSAVRVGAAVFTDAARVDRRVTSDATGDVDVGAGLRVGLPVLNGEFRLDVGKGLRDGNTAVSFVYEP